MNGDLFIIANRDLRDFVESWLSAVEAEAPHRTEMAWLQEAQDSAEQIKWGDAILMTFVAPNVVGDAGSDEELILFAVLAAFRKRPPEGWSGFRQHVEQSFAYVHEIGEATAAQLLRQEVVDDANDDSEARRDMEWFFNWEAGNNPAAIAVRDQARARLAQRTIRAANALDPGGAAESWTTLLGGNSLG